MKENISNKLIIACCVLAMFSCHARKKLAANPTNGVTTAKANTIEDKLAAIRAQQTNFNTFNAKAKTTLAFGNDSHDVTLNFRINNNKEIWVSVTAVLGIEAARAVITPDSIMVINRLQGVYIKKPFSFIYNYASKEVDYSMLQALFTGNAAPKLLNKDAGYHAGGDTVVLKGNLSDLVYKLVLGNDLKVTKTNLANEAQAQSLQVSNTFAMQDNQKVPSQIDIVSVAKSNKIEVNLHFGKVVYNQPQDYPFVIPANYKPAD